MRDYICPSSLLPSLSASQLVLCQSAVSSSQQKTQIISNVLQSKEIRNCLVIFLLMSICKIAETEKFNLFVLLKMRTCQRGWMAGCAVCLRLLSFCPLSFFLLSLNLSPALPVQLMYWLSTAF